MGYRILGAVMAKKVLQFKIYLKGIELPIWRQVQISEDSTFWNLNTAIQDAMGWQEGASHLFTAQDPQMNCKTYIGIPSEPDEPVLSEWKVRLKDYLSANQFMSYTYDLDNEWKHLIEFEGKFDQQADVHYPICLGGERRCPPEILEGVVEYKHYLEVLANPKHPDYARVSKEMGDFNPNDFDISKVLFWDARGRLDMALAEVC